MILHIPSSIALLSDSSSLNKEILQHAKMTGIYTERLFDHPTAEKIIFPIGDIKQDAKKTTIEGLLYSHDAALIQAVEEEKEKIGSALIINCQTFSTRPDPHEQKENTPRPDICIGSDPFHTPLALVFSAVKHFRARGYRVKVNEPVSGTYVPMRYSQKDRHVCSMRIEVDHKSYEDALEPLQSDLRSWLTGYLEKS